MIYVIEKFETCPVSGITDIQYSYDMGYGKKRRTESYRDRDSGYYGVLLHMKEALYRRWLNYFNRCQTLYFGGYGVTQTINRDRVFAFFADNLKKLWEKEFTVMCMNIEALRDQLHTILPAKSHPEYIALHNEAIELVVFAKQYKSFTIDNLIGEIAA